jgi:hypothetical protein
VTSPFGGMDPPYPLVTFGYFLNELYNVVLLVVEPDYLPDSEVFVFSRVYTP